MFAACCINPFIGPNPPLAFSNYEPSGEMDDFIASAHVLQELAVKYLEPSWQGYQEALKAWDAEVRADEA